MRKFWLFWTTMANYANHPTLVEANNFYEALQKHVYSSAKDVRFLVFEEGGTLVWNGTMPEYDQKQGCVVSVNEWDDHTRTTLNEPEDIQWLFDTHLKDVTLPHITPNESKNQGRYAAFAKTIKSAYLAGNEDSPTEIWLSTKENPDLRYDMLYCAYRLADQPAEAV